MGTSVEPRIESLGDAALLVTFGEAVDLGLSRRSRAFADIVERARWAGEIAGVGRPVAAHGSVLVPFDAAALDSGTVSARVREWLARFDPALASADSGPIRSIEIPVRYGGAAGPDLEDVAESHGMSPADVIAIHAATSYEVFFLGFAPGFAYLGTVSDAIATPRLDRPRERVPAGSVAIAGHQTAVYPFSMPGGWRLIGRTEEVVWDLSRDPPSLLEPGMTVRFVPAR